MSLGHVSTLAARLVVERNRSRRVVVVVVVVPELVTATLPRPVRALFVVTRIVHNGRETLTRLGFANVTLGDVLLENREQPAEEWGVVAEEVAVGDATRVHCAKLDTRRFAVALGERLDVEHVAKLGILVRLGADETRPIDHRPLVAIAILEAILQARHVAETCARGHLTRQRVGVARHRTDDDEALHVLIRRLGEVIEQEKRQQVVTEVVDPDALLKPILGVRRHGGVGQVEGGVAHERLEVFHVLGPAERLREITHALQISEFEVHHRVRILRETELVRLEQTLFVGAHRHDGKVALVDQRLARPQAETGGRARDDGHRLVTDVFIHNVCGSCGGASDDRFGSLSGGGRTNTMMSLLAAADNVFRVDDGAAASARAHHHHHRSCCCCCCSALCVAFAVRRRRRCAFPYSDDVRLSRLSPQSYPVV